MAEFFDNEQFLDDLRDRFDAHEVMWATRQIPPSQFETRQEEILQRLEQEGT